MRGTLAALLIALAACVAPTLPLPPPDQPSIGRGSDDSTFHLSSFRGAQPDAIIVVVNRNPDIPRSKRVSGAQADGDGTWETEVTAKVGDILDITQELGTTRSVSTTVRVPKL